jgi:hypothetical protein
MTVFPNDELDGAQCGGDLSLQLSAGSSDTVLHALRDIAWHTRGGCRSAGDRRIRQPATADRDSPESDGIHGRHSQPGRRRRK